jgi:hypothetical protein
MSSQIIFVSLFLGLIAGPHPIDLQAVAAVKSVRVFLAGREVATLTQPPWHALIDFGPELDPRSIEAVGYDEKGNEVGRAAQIINLPRPLAEIEIVLQTGRDGPNGVELRWEHLQFVRPRTVMMSLDRKPLKLDKSLHARLPEVDWNYPHLIAAEIKFRDGAVARREIVVGGAVTDTAQAELTPILLTETTPHQGASFEKCLLADGQPVRTAAVEKPGALVIFVRDPDATEVVRAIDPTIRLQNSFYSRNSVLHAVALDNDTSMRFLWPVAKKFADPERNAASLLFESSTEIKASAFGLVWFLTREFNGLYLDLPLQLTDAVAVAGLTTVSESRRRAVVVLLGSRADRSGYNPRVVRRYLADIGVPLFVWSLTGPRSDVANSWGEAEDISSITGLRAAADRLRATLAAQRIAWVDVDPLKALQLQADERCGVATVARPGGS